MLKSAGLTFSSRFLLGVAHDAVIQNNCDDRSSDTGHTEGEPFIEKSTVKELQIFTAQHKIVIYPLAGKLLLAPKDLFPLKG